MCSNLPCNRFDFCFHIRAEYGRRSEKYQVINDMIDDLVFTPFCMFISQGISLVPKNCLNETESRRTDILQDVLCSLPPAFCIALYFLKGLYYLSWA